MRGLRTIALRLRGTSAEVLQSEGEDVEGLVETTSKLQENIKALTSVNGEMGVSILDANGNYRDTYDILLDIANVWEELGEADAKDGKLRQAGILEMVAGKNRASLAAAIFQNPELLEDVYKDVSTNYKGSAQNELNTYLDSIEAKTTKVKESWAQLWQSEESTNVMKGVLSFTEGVLNTVNKIGPGKTAGGIGGAVLGQMFDWGRINYQFIL